MHLRAINTTRNRIVAQNVMEARRFAKRLKGLIGTRSLAEGAALHIVPCNSIHTFFMRFPIDVAFLDKHGQILHMLYAFPPWRVGPYVQGARSVLELRAGTLEFLETQMGDCIVFEAD